MNITFGVVKDLSDTLIPNKGSYSLQYPLSWYKCREQFCPKFSPTEPGLFFAYDREEPLGGESVAEFIAKTEEILAVSTELNCRSRFSKTTRPYALWVEPASFWLHCVARRSLFTILLRCGLKYNPDKDNYEEALRSDDYALSTEKAILRFLFGYNKLCRPIMDPADKTGWRDFFASKSVDDIRYWLVLPENTLLDKTLVGVGSLWN